MDEIETQRDDTNDKGKFLVAHKCSSYSILATITHIIYMYCLETRSFLPKKQMWVREKHHNPNPKQRNPSDRYPAAPIPPLAGAIYGRSPAGRVHSSKQHLIR